MPMCSEHRPRIAIPGRFSESASALRFRALVNARALLTAVWAAGGDPVTLLPTEDTAEDQVADRLRGYEGILMPGGADIDPAWYGTARAPGTDEPDRLQDEFDVAVLRHAIDKGIPLLTVCRGTQLLNAVLGGTLEQDAGDSHVSLTHTLKPSDPDFLGTGPLEVSCYHHQRIDRLAPDLEICALAEDGTIEAVKHRGARGWIRGVQWHPEDNAATDAGQRRLLAEFIGVTRDHSRLNTDMSKERHGAR